MNNNDSDFIPFKNVILSILILINIPLFVDICFLIFVGEIWLSLVIDLVTIVIDLYAIAYFIHKHHENKSLSLTVKKARRKDSTLLKIPKVNTSQSERLQEAIAYLDTIDDMISKENNIFLTQWTYEKGIQFLFDKYKKKYDRFYYKENISTSSKNFFAKFTIDKFEFSKVDKKLNISFKEVRNKEVFCIHHKSIILTNSMLENLNTNEDKLIKEFSLAIIFKLKDLDLLPSWAIVTLVYQHIDDERVLIELQKKELYEKYERYATTIANKLNYLKEIGEKLADTSSIINDDIKQINIRLQQKSKKIKHKNIVLEEKLIQVQKIEEKLQNEIDTLYYQLSYYKNYQLNLENYIVYKYNLFLKIENENKILYKYFKERIIPLNFYETEIEAKEA